MPVNLKPSEGEEYSEWRAAYNFWLSSGDSKYFDAYINEEKNIYIKITFDVNKGNIIEIYTLK